MPYLGFASNLLWVMVIGLLGPSVPSMVRDLDISYAQAGFFFTLLSLGSLIGTTVGAIASDYVHRKTLFGGCLLVLAAGLLALGFTPSYLLVAICIFLFSLFGSPIGAIGQSIMLDMFPDKRAKYLSLQTFFSALGSFIAPILVSLNYSVSTSWRRPFAEAALIPVALFIALLIVRLPVQTAVHRRSSVLSILRNRSVLASSVFIFFSVGIDLGFSYWLAEYFSKELKVNLGLSSAVVGIYLAGVLSGRFLTSLLVKRLRAGTLLIMGPSIALVGIVAFLTVPDTGIKAALCALYGLGVGPVFPLLVARGSSEYPAQSGAVTGVLFASMSLGGIVFPLVVGSIAGFVGIERSYLLCVAIVIGLLFSMIVWANRDRRSAAASC